MLDTWLTETFGLSVPVVGAPMAGVAHGRLAAAVSAAGGLGMVGVSGAGSPEFISREATVAAGAGRPYGMGLMAWVLETQPEQLDAVVAARPALVSVSFGDVARWVEPLHAAGIRVATQVGDLELARAMADAGVDVVVARGGEAGGHGWDRVATLPLLQGVLNAVDVPVLAAGGIATGRGLAAVLAAGAAGAWVGTPFLCCAEAANTPSMRARAAAATLADTAYSNVYDIAQDIPWPREYGGRALRSDFLEQWQGREDALAADAATRQAFQDAKRAGEVDVVWAGQGVGLLQEERPAVEVLTGMAEEAERLLRRW